MSSSAEAPIKGVLHLPDVMDRILDGSHNLRAASTACRGLRATFLELGGLDGVDDAALQAQEMHRAKVGRMDGHVADFASGFVDHWMRKGEPATALRRACAFPAHVDAAWRLVTGRGIPDDDELAQLYPELMMDHVLELLDGADVVGVALAPKDFETALVAASDAGNVWAMEVVLRWSRSRHRPPIDGMVLWGRAAAAAGDADIMTGFFERAFARRSLGMVEVLLDDMYRSVEAGRALQMREYLHPCIHASMHPCIHASMHPCIHASMHPCIHASPHVSRIASCHTEDVAEDKDEEEPDALEPFAGGGGDAGDAEADAAAHGEESEDSDESDSDIDVELYVKRNDSVGDDFVEHFYFMSTAFNWRVGLGKTGQWTTDVSRLMDDALVSVLEAAAREESSEPDDAAMAAKWLARLARLARQVRAREPAAELLPSDASLLQLHRLVPRLVLPMTTLRHVLVKAVDNSVKAATQDEWAPEILEDSNRRAQVLMHVCVTAFKAAHDAALLDVEPGGIGVGLLRGVFRWMKSTLNDQVFITCIHRLLHMAMHDEVLLDRLLVNDVVALDLYLFSLALVRGTTLVLKMYIDNVGDEAEVISRVQPLVRICTLRAVVAGDAERIAQLLRFWALAGDAEAARAFAARLTRLVAPGGPLDGGPAEVAALVAAHADACAVLGVRA